MPPLRSPPDVVHAVHPSVHDLVECTSEELRALLVWGMFVAASRELSQHKHVSVDFVSSPCLTDPSMLPFLRITTVHFTTVVQMFVTVENMEALSVARPGVDFAPKPDESVGDLGVRLDSIMRGHWYRGFVDNMDQQARFIPQTRVFVVDRPPEEVSAEHGAEQGSDRPSPPPRLEESNVVPATQLAT